MGIFLAIQNNLKIRDSARISRQQCSMIKVPPNLFSCLEILRLRNSDWDFWGVNFGPGIFGVLLEVLETFWVFDFWPHSITPVT